MYISITKPGDMGVNEHERHPTLQLDFKSKQRNNDCIAVLHFTVTVVLSTMSIYKSHSKMIVKRSVSMKLRGNLCFDR